MTPLEWRQKKGLTLDRVSEEIGFPKGYLSEVERGLKRGSIRLAGAYHNFTNGEVSYADFDKQ